MSLVGFKAQNHPQQKTKDEIDDRATPWEFFTPLNDKYQFTIDVAAAEHNAKCERFYDIEADGLEQSWQGERVWCNPPYSDILPWVRKAWLEFAGACDLIVMLLPANRTEQHWWQTWVEPLRDTGGAGFSVQFLQGRMRFIKSGQTEVGPNERPPFGCCLLTWQKRAH